MPEDTKPEPDQNQPPKITPELIQEVREFVTLLAVSAGGKPPNLSDEWITKELQSWMPDQQEDESQLSPDLMTQQKPETANQGM